MMLVALAGFVGAAWILSTIFARRPAERLGFAYLLLHLQVLVVGYACSAVSQLANPLAWTVGAGVFIVAAFAFARRDSRDGPPLVDTPEQPSRVQRVCFVVLLVTVLLVGCAGLVHVIWTAPHNWDSHTTHLARAAYFLQHGNLNWYEASFWGQVVHPRHHATLLSFAMLSGGEQATQAVQFMAWIAMGLFVSMAARRAGCGRWAGRIAGLASMLPINVLMQSSTTQNDLLIGSYCAAAVAMLCSQRWRRREFALFAGVVWLMLGIKASVVMLAPALGVLVLALCPRHRVLGVVSMALLGGALSLPTGYIETWQHTGHPVGSKQTRDLHAYGDLAPGAIATDVACNLLRLASDVTTLECADRVEIASKIEDALKAPLKEATHALGIELTQAPQMRGAFQWRRGLRRHEDYSQFGVIAMLLFGPLMLWTLVAGAGRRAWVIAALLFVLVQALTPYDPWRGRYFIWSVPLVAPLIAFTFSRRTPLLNALLIVGLVASCGAAIHATVYRTNSPLWSYTHAPSPFQMDRIAQLTRNRPAMTAVLRRFEAWVPPDATVAVSLPDESFEFVFFGRERRRTLHPVDAKALASEEADFLVHSSSEQAEAHDDRSLGADGRGATLYLRRLR